MIGENYQMEQFHSKVKLGIEMVTVKAFNIAPHGTFAHILARTVAPLGAFSTNDEKNQVWGSISFRNFRFLYFYSTRFDATELFERKVQS